MKDELKFIIRIALMFTVFETLIVAITSTKFSLLLKSRLHRHVYNCLSSDIRATKSKVGGGVFVTTRNRHIQSHTKLLLQNGKR